MTDKPPPDIAGVYERADRKAAALAEAAIHDGKPVGVADVDHLAMSAASKRKLRTAEGLLKIGSRRALKQAASLHRQIEVEVASQREVRGLANGIAEMAELEMRRQGVVEVSKDRATRGMTRCIQRDGLGAEFHAGHLTGLTAEQSKDVAKKAAGWMKAQVRFHAGLAYRRLHEETSSSLGSQLGKLGQTNAAKGTNDAAVFGMLAKATALRVREDRIDGPLRAKPGARELNVLRMVAGEGRTLTSLSGGGKGDTLNRAALIRALDHVAKVLRTTGYDVL